MLHQNIDINFQRSANLENSQVVLNHFVNNQNIEQDDGSLKINQEPLNLIQENININNIGSINDKQISTQNTLAENFFSNFQYTKESIQETINGSQQFDESNCNSEIQNVVQQSFNGDEQQFLENTSFKTLLINNEPEYKEEQYQQIQANKNQNEYDNLNQLDNNMNQYAEYLAMADENQQSYQQFEYLIKTLQGEENSSINLNYEYQDCITPCQRNSNQVYSGFKENQILFQPTKQNEKQIQFFFQYTEQQNEFDNSNMLLNQNELNDIYTKDKEERVYQINSNYEDDSHSQSYHSDQQFLMNSSFLESNQSKLQQENTHNKKYSNPTQQLNQTAESQQIYGKSTVFNSENVIFKDNMNTNGMENYGDLSLSKQGINMNLNNNLEVGKNQITKLDQNEIEIKETQLSKISSKFPKNLKGNQKKDKQSQDNHQKLQTLLQIFFPKQEQQITGQNLEEDKEEDEINHLDKKNIVRNLIRSFIKYFLNKQKFPQIYKIYFTHQSENETKQQFKKYFTKKKFNNHVIKQLVIHSVYGPIFRQYLENDAINYLNHSNIKCKQNHQIFINFLLKCFDNVSQLEKLETYAKGKRV